MNVNKILLFLFVLPILSFSQEKKDAYFIIDMNHDKYLIKTRGGSLNQSDHSKIGQFIIYNRFEYEKDVKERKENEFIGFRNKDIPKTIYFNVKKVEKQQLEYCDFLKLRKVNYHWIINNTWKENNPNILFKNLYFLFKTKKDTYIKYKVARTIVAY